MNRWITCLVFAVMTMAACSSSQDNNVDSATEPASKSRTYSIGVMPKLTGIAFFNATERGARAAGEELGVRVVYEGPVTSSVEDQVTMLTNWIALGFDAIAVAPNDPDAVTPVLERARRRGIKVITWDADARPAARDYFVNQATNASVARTLVDIMAEGAGSAAKYIIVTGTLTADNQNKWMAEMERYQREKYPGMTNLSPTPKAPGEDEAKAMQVTLDSLKAYPDLNGIFAITSVALPGAAEALRKAKAADRIFLTGLTTPNILKPYIRDGTVKKFVLWNAEDLGYLAVYTALAVLKSELRPDIASFRAGRIGEVRIEGDSVILGDPIVFDATNIDQYDF